MRTVIFSAFALALVAAILLVAFFDVLRYRKTVDQTPPESTPEPEEAYSPPPRQHFNAWAGPSNLLRLRPPDHIPGGFLGSLIHGPTSSFRSTLTVGAL